MSIRRKVEKKIRRKEISYEIKRLMKEKRDEDYKVFEEVFDRSTLMTVYKFLNKRIIDEIYGVVKSGKEARIYWGKDKHGNELAIKIYLALSSEFRKGMLPYIEGDPRFAHIRRNTRSLVYAWAQKEFRNLKCAFEVGVKVPHPIAVEKNVLIMDFIGKNGVSAPLLREVGLKNPQRVYKKLLKNLGKLYRRAKLVHGDLSEFNIMIWRGNPIIFDVSQAVSVEHPIADRLLQRDLGNLHRYFEKLGIETLSMEEMRKRVISGRS